MQQRLKEIVRLVADLIDDDASKDMYLKLVLYITSFV